MNNLARQAIDGIRAIQAALLGVATIVPIVATHSEDISNTGEAAITAVSAVAALLTLVLGIVNRKNVTPVSDPKDDLGRVLTPDSPVA